MKDALAVANNIQQLLLPSIPRLLWQVKISRPKIIDYFVSRICRPIVLGKFDAVINIELLV